MQFYDFRLRYGRITGHGRMDGTQTPSLSSCWEEVVSIWNEPLIIVALLQVTQQNFSNCVRTRYNVSHNKSLFMTPKHVQKDLNIKTHICKVQRAGQCTDNFHCDGGYVFYNHRHKVLKIKFSPGLNPNLPNMNYSYPIRQPNHF